MLSFQKEGSSTSTSCEISSSQISSPVELGAGRFRQEPSIAKNCCTSSSTSGDFRTIRNSRIFAKCAILMGKSPLSRRKPCENRTKPTCDEQASTVAPRKALCTETSPERSPRKSKFPVLLERHRHQQVTAGYKGIHRIAKIIEFSCTPQATQPQPRNCQARGTQGTSVQDSLQHRICLYSSGDVPGGREEK